MRLSVARGNKTYRSLIEIKSQHKEWKEIDTKSHPEPRRCLDLIAAGRGKSCFL